jgi:uncharacterized damage-inducible protein DinB
MRFNDLLTDAFERVKGSVHSAVEGLTPEQLAHRVDGETNSIAWLVWHLTRVQDDHIAAVAGTPQVWLEAGWEKRFDLTLPPTATGYGHSSADVAAVRVSSGALLTDYYDAVHDSTLAYVAGLTEADLDVVVDTRWDPPVTLGVRLVSVIDDDLEHAGQAALVRGIVERRSHG